MDGRLQKVVNLARRGEPGERENAIKIVKRICEKDGLDFDEVMKGSLDMREFELRCKDKNEVRLAFHVYAKFGMKSIEHPPYQYTRQPLTVCFRTTQETYVDVKNNFEILCGIYRKSCEDLALSYVIKNNLFYNGPDVRPSNQQITPEMMEARMRAEVFIPGVPKVEFRRAIDKK